MPSLDSEVRYIKGIGEVKARALNKLGVFTLFDLISFFPRAYEDRTIFKPIALLMAEEYACVRAMVATEPRLSRVKRGMELVKLRAVDDSGALDVTFFNQSYVRDRLHVGETFSFYGKVSLLGGRLGMTNPVFEPEGTEGGVTGRIVPVYRLSAGLSQKLIMQSVRRGMDACGEQLPDALPEAVIEKYRLARARFAYENIHFPADFAGLELARRRLIFEELFVLSCALSLLRRGRTDEDGLPVAEADTERFYAALPFAPTNAQRRAVAEAVRDMRSGRPMSRLVQGDVGSGKTLVAAACVWHAAQSSYQCAFMAPTEILAEQHLRTFTEFLAPFGLRVMKLTGSMTAREKREVKAALANGDCDLVIGTHALLAEDVGFKALALVITDEQHRFGVEQRAALSGKTASPHVLVMSATPIPRTLALIVYGDLDVSVIDELPPGRQKVDTFAVAESYRPRLNNFIRKLVGEGRQVFVVCPMIDENDELPPDLKPAEQHKDELKLEFPQLRVECIHGRMKAKDKDCVMAAFVAGEIDVLVSTTVIEVGVDVPNAALMIVENADRFGLSQLHQLRGRVGRGKHKSYCVLVSDAKGEDARARLSVMTKTSDGFKISEEDLRLRGPGDFFGSRQHGLPELHIADMCADMDVLRSAQEAASALIASDENLRKPENAPLRERAEALIASVGGHGFN
ncbi:MAG: ATP-dependent DNA helicase RecG [Oscillospiraceae bacterium]